MADRPSSRVILTCGRGGSGKSTFAHQMEREGFARLSVDDVVWDWIEAGRLTPGSDIPGITAMIETDLRGRLVELLKRGEDVIVDFAFARRAQRDSYRAMIESFGGTVELVWFRNVDPESEGQKGSLDSYIDGFEDPTEDEGAIVIKTSFEDDDQGWRDGK